MKLLKPVLFLLCAGVLYGPSASAYTHFVRYLTQTGPYTQVPQKFDLNVLPNRTVSFFVSEQGPGQLASNDSLAGVISQLRLAAAAWSGVATSDLRLAFGGVAPAAGAGQGGSPGIDIVFSEDIPPGVVAQTIITQVGEVTNAPGGAFVPIHRSLLLFPRNLSNRPSHSEAFFLTAVHELGHALGLQHALTSSVMSTEITRATSKAKPLAADDIAAVSLLYPTPGFLATTGTITGRITMSGDGVSLASVVALPVSGHPVSALTNPDGTYRIEGVPPGQYYVYAHALPPALQGETSPAGILPPVGADGRPVSISGPFETVFFPGTREPSVTVPVTAGGLSEGVNLSVQRRAAAGIHSVQSYGFLGQVTTKPAILNSRNGRGLIVAAGPGLLNSSGSPVANLSVSSVGGVATLANPLRPYAQAPTFLQMEMNLAPGTADGPQHLLFTTNTDSYVLPSAFVLASSAAPTITGVSGAVDGSGARLVTVTGTGLDQVSRLLFDGHPGAIRGVEDNGTRLLVTPPPAPVGHKANVVALSIDGQSSLLSQGNNAQTYTYDSTDIAVAATPPILTVTPTSLPAGSEAVIEISGPGAGFIDGLTKAGFGTSDFVIRKMWVVGPGRILANVGILPQATLGPANLTVTNGLAVQTQPAAFTVQAANPRALMLLPVAINPVTGQTNLTAGGPVSVFVNNLASGATVTVTLNDQPVTVTGNSNGQVTFVIPAGTASGPAIVRVRTSNEAAPALALHIDPPPPSIVTIANTTQPTRGDIVTLTISGLTYDAFTGTAHPFQISAGGVDQPVQSVIASTSARGTFEVSFTLGNLPAGTHPVIVSQDGRNSAPAQLQVR